MFLTKSDVNYKMMPLVPTSTALISSKPKIGFSIDSIVGEQKASISSYSPRSEDSVDRRQSPFNDYYGNDLRVRIQRDHDLSPHDLQTSRRPAAERDIGRGATATNAQHGDSIRRAAPMTTSVSSSPSTPPSSTATNISPGSTSLSTASPSHRRSPDLHRTPRHRSRSPSPGGSGKRPIMVPGIPANLMRPFPVAAPNTLTPEVKPIPSYLHSPEMITTHPNPHFLAAQFQMAAALAHGQGAPGYPPGAGMAHHPAHSTMQAREGYPLYPWLLSRHGRIFPHRFPGSK